MRNYSLAATLVLAGASLLSSCGPTVRTTEAAGVDMSDYKTFAYLPNTDIELPDATDGGKMVNEMIVQEVRTDLADQGYTVDRENPDLLVLISAKAPTERTTETDPVYAGYPYDPAYDLVSPYYDDYYYDDYAGYGGIIGYDVDTYTYEEGTVVVNLVDRKTKETVWKGVSRETIYETGSTDEELTKLVDDIFKKFPKVKARNNA